MDIVWWVCSCLGNIDGLDLWEALSEDLTSERMDVLHNIDDVYGNAALTVGEWKIVKGTSLNCEMKSPLINFGRFIVQRSMGLVVRSFRSRREL